ncbi:MAG: hypothetical protein ACOX89_04195 [Lutispora sp.]|jgi:hypothetical protein
MLKLCRTCKYDWDGHCVEGDDYMGLFSKNQSEDDGKLMSFDGIHIEGLPLPETFCKLHLYPEKLLIETLTNKFEIPSERLIKAKVETKQEVIHKDKSVVGRAAVGTLVAGPLGGIVGGMSGIGAKEKKKPPKTYLMITYRSSDDQEKQIAFMNNFNVLTKST